MGGNDLRILLKIYNLVATNDLILTELIAYATMRDLLRVNPVALSQRARVIASYALCGFSNVASIGIQLGGLGVMAPERRGDLARLGMRAMLVGALVSCLSGAVAGMLYR